MFLKRNEIPNISITSLYVGAIITIFSRQFKITDYGDVFTKNKFDYQKGKYDYIYIYIYRYSKLQFY